VRPIPVLQIINLICGLGMFALEWPLSFIAGSAIHRSLEVRLAILPLTALSAILLYQATNAGLYYLIGMVVYFTAYSEGEVSIAGAIPNPKTHQTDNPIRSFASSRGLCRRGGEGLGPRRDIC
jgi:hypothetical protein